MVVRLGQRVPEFALTDQDRRERRLSEFIAKGTTVIAFFPFAFSGVCDREMCAFRDSMIRFVTIGATSIVGISVDSVFTLKVFAQTYGLEFPLLSDFNRKVSKLYGVLHDPWVDFGYRGVAKRSVFVVDKKGILRYRWMTDVPSEEPPYEAVVDAVKKLSL